MPFAPAIVISTAGPADLEQLRAIDDDATALFAEHGLRIELAPEHPFVLAELARWQRSIELCRAFVAAEPPGMPLGFAALDLVDERAYLDQLAVRQAAMRRGIGARLLERAARWAHEMGSRELWLTTYAHLPFNRAFYERHGYQVVPEAQCGPGLVHHLQEQRHYLPAPEQRVAMRRSI